MKFREIFEETFSSKGFMEIEKDPEEFLTLLLIKFNAEPLLHLK